MAIHDLLNLCDFEVIAVEDCRAAIVLLSASTTHKFDLVMLDLFNASEVTAFDVLQFMKSDYKLQNIPAVITSSIND